MWIIPLGFAILIALTLIAREIIGNLADRARPEFVAPWQNFFVRVMLWLILTLIVFALVRLLFF